MNSGEAASVHVLVRGRVQGIGYRWFAQQEARRLGVTGGVRNMRDGNVEVVAEGSKDVLKQLVEVLREGPFGADVAEVEEAWTYPSGAHGNFEIWPTR